MENSLQENQKRQDELKKDILEAGFSFLTGQNLSEDEQAPLESSLLVMGITETQAIALAKKYGQLAIVIGQIGQPSEIRYC
jgi:hypothetical protein